MSKLVPAEDYRHWIVSIKQRIQSSQIKAAIAVNRELLELYWYLGEQILEKQQSAKWGDGFLEQMSRDLLAEFPEIKGFSLRNLKYMRQWVRFWSPLLEIGPQVVAPIGEFAESNRENSIVPQLVAQLQNPAQNQLFLVPWGHNRVIMDKLSSPADALFYVQKTIENNWSRAVLTHQIESGLHLREGQAINNFSATLPKPESDLAKQLLRDPYNFDFLTLTERHSERELEDGLTDHLAKFLLELGVNNIRDGRISAQDVLRVSKEIESRYSRTRLRGGELLVVVVGSGTVGNCLIVPPQYAGWNVARAIAVARLNENCFPPFIVYQFRTEDFRLVVNQSPSLRTITTNAPI